MSALALLWLRLSRPKTYSRLQRLWRFQLLDAVCSAPPPTPPPTDRRPVAEVWKLDEV